LQQKNNQNKERNPYKKSPLILFTMLDFFQEIIEELKTNGK